ncbi:YciC family protein [uncultured Umboniibacter sp.]|uniref:YciC family protein n=1 Tax=uncultured Umboniibacter sp. TaxID=1798917 RepID=UPI00262052C3|nr:YciC family protein [uncultured Umboniibacter sp.]
MSPLVQDTFKFFKQHWRYLVLFVAPIALIEHLAFRQLIDLTSIQEAQTDEALANALAAQFPTLATLELIFKPLLEGVVITATLTAVMSGAVATKVVIKRLLTVAPHLLLAFALRTVLVVFGLLMFIVPGVYLYMRLILMPVIVVDKSAGALSAMKQSWQLTGPAMGTVFVGLLQMIMWVFFPLFFIGQVIPAGAAMFFWAAFTAIALATFDIFKCRLYNELDK